MNALTRLTVGRDGNPNPLGWVVICFLVPCVVAGLVLSLAWTAVQWGWGKLTTTGGRGDHA